METNSIKITALQWYAGVAEDMRNKLFLKIITPMEYYEKLTAALKTAMEQEKKQIIDANIAGQMFIGACPSHYKNDAEDYYKGTFNKD